MIRITFPANIQVITAKLLDIKQWRDIDSL